VFLLLAKTGSSGDPLLPSRLLFKCPDAQLTARAKTLFRETPPGAPPVASEPLFALDPSRVKPSRKLDSLSPSVFGDYLDSPLLFYFKHVLGMETADDLTREPDALQFGKMVHHSLDAMSDDPGKIWACGDAARLADFLAQIVCEYCDTRFGARPWLGVTVAKESAVARLGAFAEAEVRRHAEGWDIEGSETKKAIVIAGMNIAGRCDRIDRHRGTGRFCVLDYKTSAKAANPKNAHIAAAKREYALFPEMMFPPDSDAARPLMWCNLQLPLYREFFAGEPDIEIGYVNLPAAIDKTGFEIWKDYNSELHASAMRCAEKVVEEIRAGKFNIPGRMSWPSDFENLLLSDIENF